MLTKSLFNWTKRLKEFKLNLHGRTLNCICENTITFKPSSTNHDYF